MRKRVPDDLTEREREVLALLRRDFTNEQIAERLGISLDGAKYRVSQILSKLGVATREEAAAVALSERRRWWARWPLWAKIAGLATLSAAAVGLAVLAWTIVKGNEPTEEAVGQQPTAVSSRTPGPSGQTVIGSTDASDLNGWPIVLSAMQGNDFEVYAFRADGSGLTNLSNNPANPDILPALSPDGTRIAYFVHRNEMIPALPGEKPLFVGKRDLYIENLDGTGRRQLAESFPSHDNIPPVWSPDGMRIAFESEPEQGNAEIFIIDTDGSGLRNITDHQAFDYGPTWSPDGTRIAFNSSRDGRGDIYVVSISSPEVIRLTTGIGFSPAWSPEGSLIAFWSDRDGNGEIYVARTDGSGEINLTGHPGNDFPFLAVGHFPAAWSPDGRRIAFLSDRDGDVEVYVTNADGSGQIQLTSDTSDDQSSPSWSPDGAHVLFWQGSIAYAVALDKPGSPVFILDTAKVVRS